MNSFTSVLDGSVQQEGALMVSSTLLFSCLLGLICSQLVKSCTTHMPSKLLPRDTIASAHRPSTSVCSIRLSQQNGALHAWILYVYWYDSHHAGCRARRTTQVHAPSWRPDIRTMEGCKALSSAMKYMRDAEYWWCQCTWSEMWRAMSRLRGCLQYFWSCLISSTKGFWLEHTMSANSFLPLAATSATCLHHGPRRIDFEVVHSLQESNPNLPNNIPTLLSEFRLWWEPMVSYHGKCGPYWQEQPVSWVCWSFRDRLSREMSLAFLNPSIPRYSSTGQDSYSWKPRRTRSGIRQNALAN